VHNGSACDFSSVSKPSFAPEAGFILLQLHVWNDPLMHFFMLFVLCFAQNASDAQLTIFFVINLQKRYEDIPVLGQRPAEE
jgi:hypothetical protein